MPVPFFQRLVAAASFVCISGCAGSESGPVEPTAPKPPTLASIELSTSTRELTAIGETIQIVAQGFDSKGTSMAIPSLAWSSSNVAIAEISAAGLVTARDNGSGSFTARSGAVSATIDLVVRQVATKVTVTGAPGMIKAIGVSMPLRASATDRNGNPVLDRSISWTSTADSVIRVDGTGKMTTIGTGSVEVVASVAGGGAGKLGIEVVTSRRLPVDPYLATPIAGAQWEVPVVMVSYVPTADGVNVDVRKSPDFWCLCPLSLDSVEQRILDYGRRKKMTIEQGSRYHGYKNQSAQPAIGYRIIENIIVYDLAPPGSRTGAAKGDPRFPDWFKVFADLGLADLINTKGVREVWFYDSAFDASFPSYDPAIHKAQDFRVNFESNMSSALTGDISNSYRWNDDLPILKHTYVVYGVNFRRSQAEAVHNVGHQLEAIFAYVNQRQDGNTDLFWKKFVGQDAQGAFITGRAGWTHMPPNTTGNYDYLNPTLVPTDIEDWRPDGSGTKKPTNVDSWGKLVYPWPGAQNFGQRVESQWYLYWMQNLPGRGNQIPHGTRWMTNWWAFVADWDAAISGGLGLHGTRPAATIGTGGTGLLRVPPTAAEMPHRYPVP